MLKAPARCRPARCSPQDIARRLIARDFRIAGQAKPSPSNWTACALREAWPSPMAASPSWFVKNDKHGNQADINARDAAILLSFALQHGADIDVIRRALCRDSQGRALGPIGAALDAIGGGHDRRRSRSSSAENPGDPHANSLIVLMPASSDFSMPLTWPIRRPCGLACPRRSTSRSWSPTTSPATISCSACLPLASPNTWRPG